MKVKTTAENRKDVVKAMEEILNVKAKYQGTRIRGGSTYHAE